ncbi:hypothetical protein HOLleu_17671 [Holothuria leucospilota]|uniref:Uncharacterized protein n=1 Tax=Holothuria leucospilota TaxID=206669 RepID=A0A9Q1C2D5_HOLLE|nr:hypothetical protein HOLleu_17671 [Holothuria leucospilota]
MEKEQRVHEARMKQSELGIIRGSETGSDTGGFDISKYLKFVPHFQEDSVENIFTHFEKLADNSSSLRTNCSILIKGNCAGKAQEVYYSLSIEGSMSYEVVKKAVHQAYELVPEVYQQRYRNCRKSDNQTFVEFAHNTEKLGSVLPKRFLSLNTYGN